MKPCVIPTDERYNDGGTIDAGTAGMAVIGVSWHGEFVTSEVRFRQTDDRV